MTLHCRRTSPSQKDERMNSIPSPLFCNECSRASGEQLFATAPRVDVWLLLEYNGTWGAATPADSGLPVRIIEHIQHWLDVIPNTKFQFIKRRDASDEAVEPELIHFYVARSLEISAELYKIALDSYDDLLTLDIAALALGAPEVAETLTDEQLLLVCTNGRRDAACAKYGTPTYDAFSTIAPAASWQSTHLGGHRFAATAVSLPEGVVYGFVAPEEAADIIHNIRNNTVRLDRMRGRSCYSEVVQAADYFLREKMSLYDLPGIRYVNHERIDETHWDVRFETMYNGMLQTIRVERTLSEFEVFKNSGGTSEQVPQWRYVS